MFSGSELVGCLDLVFVLGVVRTGLKEGGLAIEEQEGVATEPATLRHDLLVRTVFALPTFRPRMISRIQTRRASWSSGAAWA